MARAMPRQQPAGSEQSVGTPRIFLDAVRAHLGIHEFAIDLAASHANAVCDPYFTENTDALQQPWHPWCGGGKGWGWLNPPFSDLGPWTQKASAEATQGATLVMLVPAAPGSVWWLDHVYEQAYITWLRGRMAFVGHKDQYPKDLALLLFAPYLRGGDCIWKWR